MPLHPSARALIASLSGQPQPPDISVAQYRAGIADLPPPPPFSWKGTIEDRTIPGGDGQPMTVRIYRPDLTGPLPVVVWLHGGSFVRGTLDLFNASRCMLAQEGGCIIVAVDQRLAPEATFPKPIEDGYAALRWAMAAASGLGGDPQLVGIGGESSGANLAVAATLLAREHGGPKPAMMLLAQPLLDARLTSRSIQAFGNDYLLTTALLRWAFDLYAPGVALTDPLLSPLMMPKFLDLPPAAILTAEYDPVRDDGERFARRLRTGGALVILRRMEGYIHSFTGEDGQKLMGQMLRRLIAQMAIEK